MNGRAIAGVGLSVLGGLVLAVSVNSQRIVPPIPRGVLSSGPIIQPRVHMTPPIPPDGKPVLAGFLEDVPVGARLK